MLTQEKRSGIMSLVAERYSFTSKKRSRNVSFEKSQKNLKKVVDKKKHT